MEEDFHELVTDLRRTFDSHKTLSYEFRITQLRNLLRMYEENNSLILDALKRDMRKSKLEAYLYEVDLMKNEVRQAIRNLKKWMSEDKLYNNMLMPMDSAYVYKAPKGVVLIISPWNYPFQLALVPFSGALAAGNCVIIKPSEYAVESCLVMAKLIPQYLDRDCYKVVLGGPEVGERLLDEKYDHIFYTGNFNVARQIHQKVNKFLTPCTFELGGKSPCYVDSTCDLRMVAERIMWGKCMNMGQSCIGPDYVLCSKRVEVELVKYAKLCMNGWYGENWKEAKDLARIINEKHFHRIKHLIEGSQGEVVLGGATCEEDLWIEPTIVVNVKETDEIMQQEIFGPVLAIYTVDSEDEAIRFINSRPAKPLCLYVFSADSKTQRRFHLQTISGTLVCNDTIVHFAIDELPFGGVGESGYGYYHGKFTFDTFTHMKSVVVRDFSWIGDKVGIFRYPPYHPVKINFLSFLLCHWKKFKFVYFDYLPHLFCVLLGFLICWVLLSFFP